MPQVERREARVPDRKGARHLHKVPGGFASRSRGFAGPGVFRRSAPLAFGSGRIAKRRSPRATTSGRARSFGCLTVHAMRRSTTNERVGGALRGRHARNPPPRKGRSTGSRAHSAMSMNRLPVSCDSWPEGGAVRAATVSPSGSHQGAPRVGAYSGKAPMTRVRTLALAIAIGFAAVQRRFARRRAAAAAQADQARRRELLDLARADLRRRHLRPHQRRDALLFGDRGARRLAAGRQGESRARRVRAPM